MPFAIGFLLGSLLLLVLILYVTRIRDSPVPTDEPGDAPPVDIDTQECEICDHQGSCETVGGLTLCSSCHDDLMT